MQITVYTTPNCMPCQATKKMLDRRGIVYDVINLQQHPEKAEEFKEMGMMQTPIVVAGEKHWSGFRLDRLMALENALFGDRREGKE